MKADWKEPLIIDDNGVNPPLEPATKKEQQTRQKSVLGWWENEYPGMAGKAFKSEQPCDGRSSKERFESSS